MGEGGGPVCRRGARERGRGVDEVVLTFFLYCYTHDFSLSLYRCSSSFSFFAPQPRLACERCFWGRGGGVNKKRKRKNVTEPVDPKRGGKKKSTPLGAEAGLFVKETSI